MAIHRSEKHKFFNGEAVEDVIVVLEHRPGFGDDGDFLISVVRESDGEVIYPMGGFHDHEEASTNFDVHVRILREEVERRFKPS